MEDPRIGEFLMKLDVVDGVAPLSDAKLSQLPISQHTMVVEEGEHVVAVGVAAQHWHVDGAQHWSIEIAVEPGLRFPEFEDRLLHSALSLIPAGEAPTVWSHRRSLDAALARAGFVATRELAHMSIELPIEGSGEVIETRPMRPSDTSEILAVNRSAFSSHREAGSLTEPEFNELLHQDGMGSSGLLVLEQSGSIVGFCWTRVHPNGEGEMFRIAVQPEHQGRGLGRALTVAAFDYLARIPNVSIGTLWVDLSNASAVHLYKGLGMVETRVNREFGILKISG